jgi:hypothetical protein
MSPVFGKILGKVEIWEVAKIAAMLPGDVIAMLSKSTLPESATKARRK